MTACEELILNGYSDWHLPSKEELNSVYVNLKQVGVGGFADNVADNGFWSSSETNDGKVSKQYFNSGMQSNYSKNLGYKYSNSLVRAVRAF